MNMTYGYSKMQMRSLYVRSRRTTREIRRVLLFFVVERAEFYWRPRSLAREERAEVKPSQRYDDDDVFL